MADNLAARVTRIVSGTANSLVSAFENLAPEMIMEEAVREVDKAIDDVRAELGRVLSKAHMANVRLAEENRKHDELSEKIRLALTESREDLAETAVSRLVDIEAQIPLLEATIADTREAQRELEGFIAALQCRKREMKEDLSNLRERTRAAEIGSDRGSPTSSNGVAAAVEKAEEAFGRAMDQAGGLAAAGGTMRPSSLN